jgi:cadmium resistance protein CadD (predicted permease)
MDSFLALIGLAIVVFVSTNIDDVFVLVGFFADKNFRARDVVVGQYVGVCALYLISAMAALISLVIPTAYIGLLGLAPITIGIKKLYLSMAQAGDRRIYCRHWRTRPKASRGGRNHGQRRRQYRNVYRSVRHVRRL